MYDLFQRGSLNIFCVEDDMAKIMFSAKNPHNKNALCQKDEIGYNTTRIHIGIDNDTDVLLPQAFDYSFTR